MLDRFSETCRAKGDVIDHAVGLVVHRKVGDEIAAGDELFTVHANSEDALAQAETRVLNAHVISSEAIDPLPHFHKTIEGNILTLRPALVITQKEMDRAIDIIDEAIGEVEQGKKY